MDHIARSKTFIIELAKLRFSIRYDQVKRFKQSVATESQSEDEENVSSIFSQWVADNCDHNANTKDGKGVFNNLITAQKMKFSIENFFSKCD